MFVRDLTFLPDAHARFQRLNQLSASLPVPALPDKSVCLFAPRTKLLYSSPETTLSLLLQKYKPKFSTVIYEEKRTTALFVIMFMNVYVNPIT